MSKLTLASTYNLNKLQGLLQILSTALGLNTFNNYKVINIKGEWVPYKPEYILNETSKPPVNKTHLFITKLFEMMFDKVYFGTCILNWT